MRKKVKVIVTMEAWANVTYKNNKADDIVEILENLDILDWQVK